VVYGEKKFGNLCARAYNLVFETGCELFLLIKFDIEGLRKSF